MTISKEIVAREVDFFCGEEKIKHLLDEEFKKSMLKRVNGLFARYNELEEVIWNLRESLERLKQNAYTR